MLLARWWQAVIFNPGGLKKELYQIRLSYLSVALFVAAAGLSWLGNLVSMDIMPILYAGFGAAGFSLLHNLLARLPTGRLWLTVVYIGFIIVFPRSIEIIAMFAVLDVLLNFRERWGHKVNK